MNFWMSKTSMGRVSMATITAASPGFGRKFNTTSRSATRSSMSIYPSKDHSVFIMVQKKDETTLVCRLSSAYCLGICENGGEN